MFRPGPSCYGKESPLPAFSPRPQRKHKSLLDKSNQLEKFFDCPAAETQGDSSRSPCQRFDMPLATLLPQAVPTPSPPLRGYHPGRTRRVSLFREMLRGFLQGGPASLAIRGWEHDVIEGLLSLGPHPCTGGMQRGEPASLLEKPFSGQPLQSSWGI